MAYNVNPLESTTVDTSVAVLLDTSVARAWGKYMTLIFPPEIEQELQHGDVNVGVYSDLYKYGVQAEYIIVSVVACWTTVVTYVE